MTIGELLNVIKGMPKRTEIVMQGEGDGAESVLTVKSAWASDGKLMLSGRAFDESPKLLWSIDVWQELRLDHAKQAKPSE